MSNVASSWLPNLLGPQDVQQDGTAVDVPRRDTFNFCDGIVVTDEEDYERTRVGLDNIPISKLAGGAQTFDATSVSNNANAKATPTYAQAANVQTTDGTQTTLASLTWATTGVLALSVLVTATKSDGTQGAAWSVTAAFRCAAGTLTQLGTATAVPIGTADDAAWAVTIDRSGTTIRVRVTGNAGDTIQWGCIYTSLSVIP